MGEYALSFIDAASQLASMSIHTGPINSATIASVSGQADALRAALDPIIRGNIRQEDLSAYINKLQVLPPSDKEARRIQRWRITWTDTTQYINPPLNSILNPNWQKIFTTHIPTADATLCDTNSNSVADLTVAPWDAFVTAFQDLVRSDSNGQSKILSVTYLDR